jgi:hypothetical protein
LVPIVFNIRHQTASGMQAKYIRPIKTERELAIEAACSVMELDACMSDFNKDVSCSAAIRFTIEKLFDAGMLRSKNES